MENTGKNPFASPETELDDEYQSNLRDDESIFRWIMLSTISGGLLFGTFCFLTGLLLYVSLFVILWLSGQINMANPSALAPMFAAFLLAITLYAMFCGAISGSVHGLVWFYRRAQQQKLLGMIFLGCFLSIFILLGPIIALFQWFSLPMSPQILGIMVVLVVGGCLAVWRLNLNIRKFLLTKKPEIAEVLVANAVSETASEE